jgi:ABC-2 type transport system permease protein
MRNVFLIARRDLTSWVTGPAGYLIGALFLLLDGLLFNSVVVADLQLRSADLLSFFFQISNGLAIIMAVLLSMGLLAEDVSLGTRALLLTSPVKEGEIVLGKYLAALVVITVLAALSFHLPMLLLVHGKISWGHVAAGYGGVFLTGASALAIGTLSSALAPRMFPAFAPFFAVIIAAAICALLILSTSLASSGMESPLSDVFSSVALWVPPPNGRPFTRGLIQLSDIAYFVSVIYFSLIAAVRVLQWQRWR